jgi:nitroreductase
MKPIARLILSKLPARPRAHLVAAWRRTRDDAKLMHAFLYDWRLYRSRSGLFRQSEQGTMEAQIIKAYHRIEKGLALPQPRPGFGRDAVAAILDGVDRYVSHFGTNATTARALRTLEEYVRFNQARGADVQWIAQPLSALRLLHLAQGMEGGTRAITREQVHAVARIDLSRFFASRYSIRQFCADPVDRDLITKAVTMAKKSPSVCNRESGCVFVVSEAARKAALLELQNGNRGFGEQADRILVITSRIDSFLTVGERYQCWIDGGLFAMSLIYALHSLGVGSCCLNWSVEPHLDQALKRVSGIPDDHAVIMLLAVGQLPETLRVAQSPRRPLNDVLHFIE